MKNIRRLNEKIYIIKKPEFSEEPNSEEMALEFARLSFPTCSNIGFDDYCVPTERMAVKLLDARKINCNQIQKGKNYQCEFRITIDCQSKGLGIAMCSAFKVNFNSKSHKMGFRKFNNKWNIYSLTEKQRNSL